MKKVLFVSVIAVLALAVSACNAVRAPQQEVSVITTEAPVPEGVVRYCWEEPIVDSEKVDAGLDEKGQWYRPGHVQIREVRMGRWRPCNDVTSRTYGRYGNER